MKSAPKPYTQSPNLNGNIYHTLSCRGSIHYKKTTKHISILSFSLSCYVISLKHNDNTRASSRHHGNLLICRYYVFDCLTVPNNDSVVVDLLLLLSFMVCFDVSQTFVMLLNANRYCSRELTDLAQVSHTLCFYIHMYVFHQ